MRQQPERFGIDCDHRAGRDEAVEVTTVKANGHDRAIQGKRNGGKMLVGTVYRFVLRAKAGSCQFLGLAGILAALVITYHCVYAMDFPILIPIFASTQI